MLLHIWLCYYNDANCIPEGGHIAFNHIIYNPHDNYTNVSVTWLRSIVEDRSTYEILPTFSEEYHYAIVHTSSISVKDMGTNCSLSLYRDTYSIVINNFTREKNGYYWCQLAINNTYTQPSHHSWFYAGNSSACSSNYHYFRPALLMNEVQCAQIEHAFLYTIQTSKSLTTSQATLLAISETSGLSVLIYALGSFSALLLIVLLGILVLAFLLAFYVHHQRKKTSKFIFMVHTGE